MSRTTSPDILERALPALRAAVASSSSIPGASARSKRASVTLTKAPSTGGHSPSTRRPSAVGRRPVHQTASASARCPGDQTMLLEPAKRLIDLSVAEAREERRCVVGDVVQLAGLGVGVGVTQRRAGSSKLFPCGAGGHVRYCRGGDGRAARRLGEGTPARRGSAARRLEGFVRRVGLGPGSLKVSPARRSYW